MSSGATNRRSSWTPTKSDSAHSLADQRFRLATIVRKSDAKALPAAGQEGEGKSVPVIACDACGERSVIRLQESHLCGRCLWAVSLLLRNRMPSPALPSQGGADHAEAVRQAIEDVLHLRQRLATLESEIAT